MKPTFSGKMYLLGRIITVGLLATQAVGHSWIEQLVNLDDSGKYVGEFGYIRNYQDKGDPAVLSTVQEHDKYMLPPTKEGQFISKQNPICHPAAQKPGQTDKFPKLKTAPGQFIAMRYAENGHVSQPNQLLGKPEKGGTNYVFGTTKPKEGETLANVLQWTADGSGGDGNGRLLTAQTFDDGRCYENSNEPIASNRKIKTPNKNMPLLCETDLQIPKDAKTGEELTLYWVWQWPTMPKFDKGIMNGKDEYYMSCMDVDIVEKVNTKAKPSFTLAQQDAMTEAVSDFKSRTALPASTNPTVNELGTIFGGGQQTGAPQSTGAQPTGAQPTGVAPTTTGTLPASNTANVPNIPTITNRPGHTGSPGGGNKGADDVVTITVTEKVTVTAPQVTTVAVAPTPKGLANREVEDDKTVNAYSTARHRLYDSAKFRGRV